MRFKLKKKQLNILITLTAVLLSVTLVINLNKTNRYSIPHNSKVLYDSNISFHFVVNGSAPASNSSNARNMSVSYELFSERLTPNDELLMEELLGVVDEVLTKHGVLFFMCCGTLLGSYRYMDRLPWDDDAEVMVPIASKWEVFKLLNSLDSATYELTAWTLYQARFSSKTRQRIHAYRAISFPFVDIYFYQEDESFLILDTGGSKIPKNPVFPLTRRPFGRLWLPSPCDPPQSLTPFYGNLSSCESPRFDQRRQKVVRRFEKVGCDGLDRWTTRVERIGRQPLSYDDIASNETLRYLVWEKTNGKQLYNQVERLYMGDRLLREILIVGVC